MLPTPWHQRRACPRSPGYRRLTCWRHLAGVTWLVSPGGCQRVDVPGRRVQGTDARPASGRGTRRGRAPAARAAARISVIIVRQVIADDRAGDDAPGLLWSRTGAWPRNITRAAKPDQPVAGHLFPVRGPAGLPCRLSGSKFVMIVVFAGPGSAANRWKDAVRDQLVTRLSRQGQPAMARRARVPPAVMTLIKMG